MKKIRECIIRFRHMLTIRTAHVFHTSKHISTTKQEHRETLSSHMLDTTACFVSYFTPPLEAMTLLLLMYMVEYTLLWYYKRVTLEWACQTPTKIS